MRPARLTATSALSLPANSYIYKIVPVNGRLAAISSDDSLRLLDPATLQEIGGVLDHVHDGVTCLQAAGHDDPNGLWTAGRDAAVRRYDVRSGLRTLQLGDDSKAPFLSLATHGATIAAGTELSHSQAAVLLWDARSPHRPLRNYVESHNDDVTELRFHPTSGLHCLLSGSTDGLVNLYDASVADEDDALAQVQNHGSSVHRAGFFLSSDPDAFFFALSHDETFAVYRVNGDPPMDDSPPAVVFGDLRPKLDCEYVVDVIPCNSSNGVEAIVGAGSHSKQQLDLVPLRRGEDWSFDAGETIRLSGAHGEEIVRSILVSDKDGTIFTAGEDGLVKAWRTSMGGGGGGQEQAEAERPRKKKKRSTADGGNESGRFKPY